MHYQWLTGFNFWLIVYIWLFGSTAHSFLCWILNSLCVLFNISLNTTSEGFDWGLCLFPLNMENFFTDSAHRSDEGKQTDIKKKNCVLLSYFLPLFLHESSSCHLSSFLFPRASSSKHITPLILSHREAQKALLFSLFSPNTSCYFHLSSWTLPFPTPDPIHYSIYTQCC